MTARSTGLGSGRASTILGSQLITHQLTTRWKLSPSMLHHPHPSASSSSFGSCGACVPWLGKEKQIRLKLSWPLIKTWIKNCIQQFNSVPHWGPLLFPQTLFIYSPLLHFTLSPSLNKEIFSQASDIHSHHFNHHAASHWRPPKML